MNIVQHGTNFNLTMSSREIAELCEKRHAHVLRDIEQMIQDIAEPKFGLSDFEGSYKDATGRSLKEYRLPKDLTVTLITGYRADLRYKVIKRLDELENKQSGAFALPQSFGEALRLAADQHEQIEELKPKALALDRLEGATGSFTVRPASKVLGIGEQKLIKWLEAHRWAFRSNGKGPLQAYVDKRNAGYLDHRLHSYEVKETGETNTAIQMLITSKGMAKLAVLTGGAA